MNEKPRKIDTDGAEAEIAERRRHRRFFDEVRVRYRDIEGVDPSGWGRSRDLSLGGMGLVGVRSLAVGSHLALEIHVESEPAPIMALGRVVRVRTSDPQRDEANLPDEAAQCDAGLEFIWLSVEDRDNLERLADYFRQKYGTAGELEA